MTWKPILIVMRHGRAVPKEQAGSDENRWLLPEAREEARLVARLLPVKPSAVYTSPLRRARETAEIVAEETGSGVVVTEHLSPGKTSCRGLDGIIAPGAVLVGHNPDLEELVSCLIGGGNVHLSAGSAAVLEYTGDGAPRPARAEWRLLELITPGLARRAAERLTRG